MRGLQGHRFDVDLKSLREHVAAVDDYYINLANEYFNDGLVWCVIIEEES